MESVTCIVVCLASIAYAKWISVPTLSIDADSLHLRSHGSVSSWLSWVGGEEKKEEHK
jgi:hypothetical protein